VDDGDVGDGDPARQRHEDVATSGGWRGVPSAAMPVGEAWEAAEGWLEG
jgi:hypothetical protein